MTEQATGNQRTADVSTYLAWSIFSTICCCFPLGIVAIVFSIRTDNANNAGDVSRAQEYSTNAKKLNIAAVVTGIIMTIIYIVIMVVMSVKR